MVPDAARSCFRQGSATVLCGKNRKTLHWRENMRTYQNIWEQYGSKVPSVVSSKWRQHGDPSLSAYLTNFNKASGCKSVSPRSAKLGGQKKQTWSRNEVLESSELHYKVSHLVHQLGLGSSHLWASEFSLLHPNLSTCMLYRSMRKSAQRAKWSAQERPPNSLMLILHVPVGQGRGPAITCHCL